jgi:hypothetical protein
MAYALVGSIGTVNQSAAAGNDANPTFAQTTTASNLLILWVTGSGTASTFPATPSGWTLACQINGLAKVSSSLYWKIAVGSDTAPTITGVANVLFAAQLGEFSGGATASPVDQTATPAASTTSTLAATAGGTDVASGELVCSAAAIRYSAGTVITTSHSFNNGTAHDTKNDGPSVANHYNHSYTITTGNASANSDTFSFTTTNIQGASVALASFKLAAAAAVVHSLAALGAGK